MIDNRTAGYGALLLRVTLGVMFLAHWSLKMFVYTPAGAARSFASLGLPAPLFYLDMIGELGIGVCLILGVATRWVALLGVPILLGTIVMVHGANGFFFSNKGGGWEYPAVWTAMLVAQALLGDGAAALGPRLIPALSSTPRPA